MGISVSPANQQTQISRQSGYQKNAINDANNNSLLVNRCLGCYEDQPMSGTKMVGFGAKSEMSDYGPSDSGKKPNNLNLLA